MFKRQVWGAGPPIGHLLLPVCWSLYNAKRRHFRLPGFPASDAGQAQMQSMCPQPRRLVASHVRLLTRGDTGFGGHRRTAEILWILFLITRSRRSLMLGAGTVPSLPKNNGNWCRASPKHLHFCFGEQRTVSTPQVEDFRIPDLKIRSERPLTSGDARRGEQPIDTTDTAHIRLPGPASEDGLGLIVDAVRPSLISRGPKFCLLSVSLFVGRIPETQCAHKRTFELVSGAAFESSLHCFFEPDPFPGPPEPAVGARLP